MKNGLNLVLAILWLIVIGCACPPPRTDTSPSPASPQSQTTPFKRSDKDIARTDTDVIVKAHKGGFGAVFLADVTVNNRSTFIVKDFHIECTLSGASGTEIDKVSQIVYQKVPPKKRLTFREINFGFVKSQVSSYSCALIDLEVE